MATLIVTFHCMCLFVPDEDGKAMHVLMPGIHGSHGAGARGAAHRAGARGAAQRAGAEEHVVRMLHRSFKDEPQGRPMDGLSLVVKGTDALNLDLNPAGATGPELPDLTTISGNRVNPKLITDKNPELLAARVSFLTGRATEKNSDPYHYSFGGKAEGLLANAVTWVIRGVDDELDWIPIDDTAKPPIQKLSELDPEVDGIYKINIHHETKRTLPGGGGPLLSNREMQLHFAMYYVLLGLPAPAPGSALGKLYLPQGPKGGGGGVQCESAMARLK